MYVLYHYFTNSIYQQVQQVGTMGCLTTALVNWKDHFNYKIKISGTFSDTYRKFIFIGVAIENVFWTKYHIRQYLQATKMQRFSVYYWKLSQKNVILLWWSHKDKAQLILSEFDIINLPGKKHTYFIASISIYLLQRANPKPIQMTFWTEAKWTLTEWTLCKVYKNSNKFKQEYFDQFCTNPRMHQPISHKA